jgi:hypothetical protein
VLVKLSESNYDACHKKQYQLKKKTMNTTPTRIKKSTNQQLEMYFEMKI